MRHVSTQSTTSSSGWQAFGSSVLGARHARKGRENEDAYLWSPVDGRGVPVAVAVADGHGSAEYVRSRQGARIAVEATIDELLRLTAPEDANADLTLTDIKRAATERLPAVLVRRFEQEVHRHLTAHPVTAEDLDAIERQVGINRRRYVERDPMRIYGSTLLAAVVTEHYAVYLQLGDGDILVVAADGDVIQPFPRDPRHIGNETSSLVSANAWGEVRVHFQAFAGAPPVLIVLSTDGYANCFSTPEAFLRVGSDILQLIRGHGLDTIRGEVDDWLQDAAMISGDDTTLVVLARLDALTASAETVDADGGSSGDQVGLPDAMAAAAPIVPPEIDDDESRDLGAPSDSADADEPS